ncbi:MAG: hypothetical protein AAF086_00075 [Planctomycetota bacterium]
MTQTLLAAAELWQVNSSTQAPEWETGFYTDCQALRGVQAQQEPGSAPSALDAAIKTGQPKIINDLSELGFLVAEAAKTDGVEAALIFPAYQQGEVTTLLVMYFRGGGGLAAGIELWSGTKGRFELSLAESYYTGLDRFARISQYVNFPRGAGLPGQCWDTAMPQLVPDLGTAKGFLRSSGAESDGLKLGMGIPIMQRTELRSVLLMLSSPIAPIARVHEIWVQDPDKAGQLVRRQGVYGGLVELKQASEGLTFSLSDPDGLPGRAWAAGKPLLLDGMEAINDAGFQRGQAVQDAGLSFALALPVKVVDEVRAVALLMG